MLMTDTELAHVIQHPSVEIYSLVVGGTEAGFAELDCRQLGEVELAYFGLLPTFTGQGLGAHFLQRIVALAWAHQPRRVWLHTCEWDHPAARPLYLRAGFVQYAERWVNQIVLD
jgi:GNAT superfamily N-acetyltransferase